MIALSVTVRATEPGHTLTLFGRSLRRFRHLPARDGNVIVFVANIGQVLLTEASGRIQLDMVAPNETAAASMVEVVSRELALAAPDRAIERSFFVEWNRPSLVPAPLR
jgi:hypothetical protein